MIIWQKEIGMDGKSFNYLGISTGCIINSLSDDERKKIMLVILHMQQIMN